MRRRLYLNRNWKFTDSFVGSMLIEPMSDGETVELPHTFAESSFNYVNSDKLRAQCVYQRIFFAREEWKDKILILTFEGVAQKASVYINGVNLIIHECGSTVFQVEIDSKVNYGMDNLITVLVDSRDSLVQPPFVSGMPTDAIPFGGIYRDVYLTIKEKISMEDVFYRPETSLPPDTKGMNLERLEKYKIPGIIKTTIKLSDLAIRMSRENRLYVRQFLNDEEIAFQPLSENGETLTATGPVHIWDIDSPTCYRIQTDLIFDDIVVDQDVSIVGFRTAVFDQSGFYLNGRKVKIRGIVRNQAFPYVGYAMPESLQRLDARILKEELHVNAVRSAGEYPSPGFIDECDKRGILVFCEPPGYRNIGGGDFKSIHLKNIEEMILAGRNHPSIFLWGVRISGAISTDLDKQATALAHSLDPTRYTGGERLEREMAFEEDIYCYTDLSYNGKGSPLMPKGEVTGDMMKPYLVSGYLGESYPVRPTDSPKRKAGQIAYAASVLDAQAFMDDICGSFAICMTDHLSLSECAAEDGMVYHGIMDAFRNKKPVGHLFASQNNIHPQLSVYPPLSGDRERWEGFGEVYIITNADTVNVYRDDEFICEYTKEDSPFGHMRHGPILLDDFLGDDFFGDEVKQEQGRRIKKMLNQMAHGGLSSFLLPGQVMDRIVGRIIYRMSRRQLLDLYEKYVSKSHEYRFEAFKGGKPWATTLLKPFSSKYLRVDASAMNLIERHGYDAISVRIMVSNEAGEVLSEYCEPVEITVDGPVRLIGPGIVTLRGGMAGTYIRSIGKEGEATINISCGDLMPVSLSINVLRAPEEEI